jgi:acyl carrier protein
MTTETPSPVDLGNTEAIAWTVLGIAREVLDRPALESDTDFFDVGATSLTFVRILAEVNRRLSVPVHPAELLEATAAAIAELVARASSAAATTPIEPELGA